MNSKRSSYRGFGIYLLLILAIKDIFKILSILILLQHVVNFHNFFSGNPAV